MHLLTLEKVGGVFCVCAEVGTALILYCTLPVHALALPLFHTL